MFLKHHPEKLSGHQSGKRTSSVITPLRILHSAFLILNYSSIISPRYLCTACPGDLRNIGNDRNSAADTEYAHFKELGNKGYLIRLLVI